MRRVVLALLAVALTLAAVAAAFRQDRGWSPDRATPPHALGPAAGETSAGAPSATVAPARAVRQGAAGSREPAAP